MSKIVNLKDAAGQIRDGMIIGIGGNVLGRSPSAFLREMVRQDKRNLKLVKTAGAHDVDLLVRGGCVYSVDAGFISYETEYGLARYYRKAVETGNVIANEHACYTVMCALRAAKTGVGFMPVRGLQISDLIHKNDYFKKMNDPFTGEEVGVVKALIPDVTVIHVHECDKDGNAIIYGPRYDDVLLVKAAKKVIITTEKIVDQSKMRRDPSQVVIPGFLVDKIVILPNGAKPCGVHNIYEVDDGILKTFLSDTSDEGFNKYLKTYERIDHYKSWGVK